MIGKAAAGVGSETRSRTPTIPWPDVVSMRNRLIHAYFEIDLDRVWATVTQNLPPLVDQLKSAISASDDTTS